MALMRSGQKGLDEIQRIRVAMEGGNPVITEAQQELIKKSAALLGEDGDAIIQDIQTEAEIRWASTSRHFQNHRGMLPRSEQESGESREIKRSGKREGDRETDAGGGHEGAGDQVQWCQS
jgi:hypothetical protein